MKDFLIVLCVAVAAVFVGTFAALHFNGKSFGDAGMPFFYNSPTMATSSVGTYAPVKLLTRDGGRQFATVCNTSPTSTNDLILQFDATSTGTSLNPLGMIVPGNSCYEINQNRLFVGDLYGIFSTNTSTVEALYK